MQDVRRLEINVERDVRCRWRRRSAAEIAMLAGVAGNEIGFARRLVTRSTGMGNAMADVREGIDRRHGKGANARQDHMQRDRIDRQQSCALPQYVTHRSDALNFTNPITGGAPAVSDYRLINRPRRSDLFACRTYEFAGPIKVLGSLLQAF